MDVYKNKADKIKDERLKAKAKESGLKIVSELAKRLNIFKAIKQMFNSTKKQKVQVAETDILAKISLFL